MCCQRRPIPLQRLQLNSKLCADLDQRQTISLACAPGCIKAHVIIAASESQAACNTKGEQVLVLQVEALLMHSRFCCTRVKMKLHTSNNWTCQQAVLRIAGV